MRKVFSKTKVVPVNIPSGIVEMESYNKTTEGTCNIDLAENKEAGSDAHKQYSIMMKSSRDDMLKKGGNSLYKEDVVSS